jgi:hypothetical protein
MRASDPSGRPTSYARIPRVLAALAPALLAVPPLVAVVFVLRFSSAFPLTDEWFFTKAIVSLQGIELFTREGLERFLQTFPRHFGEHCVIVPFLAYWPLAEWSSFDSRCFIGVTLLTFGVQAFLYRRYLVRSSLWVLPVVLLLFAPSHYMEMLWGWQFTLALSIAFPLVGLAAIARMPVGGRIRAQIAHLLAGLLAVVLGTLSSAGGFFGFPCAVLLVLLMPLERKRKAAYATAIGLAATVGMFAFADAPARTFSLGLRELGYGLTALGATIWARRSASWNSESTCGASPVWWCSRARSRSGFALRGSARSRVSRSR